MPELLTGHRDALAGLSKGLTRALALSTALVVGVLLAWPTLSSQAGLFSAEGPRVFFSNTTPGIALALAGVAAIAEEVLFRGVLLAHLRRKLHVHVAVALQAILFGLIHAGYGSMLHVAAATAFGALMGYLAHRHGLLPAILVHFVVNVAVLAAWAEQAALLGTAITLLTSLGLISWLLRDYRAPEATEAPEPEGTPA